MNNYYLLNWKTSHQCASAFAPSEIKLDHELIPELDDVDELPFELELIKLTETKNGLIRSNEISGLDPIWLDYQPNSLAWPLMSEKMKTVIENNLTGKEGVSWITTRVNGEGKQKTYYILRFAKMLDVLDQQKTLFVKSTGQIIKPHFSLLKVASLSIFHKPSSYNLWKITSGLYVSEKLKKAIQKEGLLGIGFEKTAVS